MSLADISNESLMRAARAECNPLGLAEEVIRLRAELRTKEEGWAKTAGLIAAAHESMCVDLRRQVKVLESDCAAGDCRACVKCCDAALAECDALAGQMAALRSVGVRFFDFIAGLEAFEHGNGDGDRLAGDLEEVLADTAKAAADHDAAIRKAALERAAVLVENLQGVDATLAEAAAEIRAFKEKP